MAARPLLVGWANPHSEDPGRALAPRPAGAAGARLAAILGLTERDYLRSYDRANLADGGSDPARRARALWRAAARARRPAVVLLGRDVAETFRSATRALRPGGLLDVVGPFMTIATFGPTTIALPHPSGRCRTWNDRRLVGRAREILRRAGLAAGDSRCLCGHGWLDHARDECCVACCACAGFRAVPPC